MFDNNENKGIVHMKLQISFDMTNLDKAISIAKDVAEYADILEVGTILIYQHGVGAVQAFREQFPRHTILADTKIINQVKDTIPLFARAGANWITLMAGTPKDIIHASTTSAYNLNLQIMLDLTDSGSLAQSALDAKKLGVNALLLNQHYDTEKGPHSFLEAWELVKGNTELPIFICSTINRENIETIVRMKPDGIVIGSSITEAENPTQEAQFFRNALSAE